ncbi:unnamed protein product [Lactuca virosa]|uniref:Uncharacterized protein n=1 Tax=Lactuca virosa TaxID=75947 RepID=A0AAU9LEU9_9ASTR|nr:unnamed protein product [Lactuca virosa]
MVHRECENATVQRQIPVAEALLSGVSWYLIIVSVCSLHIISSFPREKVQKLKTSCHDNIVTWSRDGNVIIWIPRWKS